ncbi:MAG: hypothetical protein V1904_06570 [Bacteroidota bacterium]
MNCFQKYLFLLLITIFFAFIISCKKETEDPVDVGYDYFPVNIGHWVTYEVDSVVLDNFYPVGHPLHMRTYHYDIKEEIESEFYDNEGRLTQRLVRYQKSGDTSDWFLKDVWVMNRTTRTAEKVEENYRYIKLAFAIEDGCLWNGNAFNSLDEQDYEYDDVFKPATVNGITFDSTVTVKQKIDSNVIEAFNQYEIFAKKVGLVYKRYRELHVFFSDTSAHKDTLLTDYTYRIITYGNN